MSENNQEKNLTKPISNVPMEIHLGQSTSIDLSWLPEKERQTLLIDYTKGMLDINKTAHELHVDAAVLKKTLEGLSDTTRDVSENGNAVTITHSQTTKVGRTEVMMGNTGQAERGKLSKSQAGEKDWMPLYILGGILTVLVFIMLMKG